MAGEKFGCLAPEQQQRYLEQTALASELPRPYFVCDQPSVMVDPPCGNDWENAWMAYRRRHRVQLKKELDEKHVGENCNARKIESLLRGLAKAALRLLPNEEQWEYALEGETSEQNREPKVPLPFSKLSKPIYKQRRLSALRQALEAAAGAECVDLSIVLQEVLTADEKDKLLGLLLPEKFKERETEQLAFLMRRVAKDAARTSSKHNCQVPLDLLCISGRECGHTDRNTFKKLLDVDIGRKAWKRSESRKLLITKKKSNGRLGLRKIPTATIEKILVQNSTATCKPFEGGRGRKRKTDAGEEGMPEPKQARALTDSVSSIHFSSSAFCGICDPSYLPHILKRDFKWIRPASRKLDCCMKCRQWDWQILPMARKSLKGYINALNALMPGFTLDFYRDVELSTTSHQRTSMAHETLLEFSKFLESRRRGGIKPSKAAKLTVKTARALEREVDRIQHEINRDWPKAKGAKVGLLDVICMHQAHFTHRDSYQDVRQKCDEEPEADTLYYQMDFLQHRTLPIGPEEGGEWWYANARLSVTLLVIYVWGRGVEGTYHTYASHCLEQTPEFTVACLRDLHEKIGGAGKWKRHVMFSGGGYLERRSDVHVRRVHECSLRER